MKKDPIGCCRCLEFRPRLSKKRLAGQESSFLTFAGQESYPPIIIYPTCLGSISYFLLAWPPRHFPKPQGPGQAILTPGAKDMVKLRIVPWRPSICLGASLNLETLPGKTETRMEKTWASQRLPYLMFTWRDPKDWAKAAKDSGKVGLALVLN